MKKVVYTDHLKTRLKIRNFPEKYPLEIYQNPEQTFIDNVEKTNIAIRYRIVIITFIVATHIAFRREHQILFCFK